MIAELYKKQTHHVILITGRYATKKRIMQSLQQQFALARKEDTIVFAFSGHGYPGGICPYDMTSDIDSGISYADIQTLLKKTKANKRLLLQTLVFREGSG